MAGLATGDMYSIVTSDNGLGMDTFGTASEMAEFAITHAVRSAYRKGSDSFTEIDKLVAVLSQLTRLEIEECAESALDRPSMLRTNLPITTTTDNGTAIRITGTETTVVFYDGTWHEVPTFKRDEEEHYEL